MTYYHTVSPFFCVCALLLPLSSTKAYANIVFLSPMKLPFLGSDKLLRVLDNPHAFAVHGVRSTKGKRRSSRSPHHSNTVKCRRKHSLKDDTRSNMDSHSSEQHSTGLTTSF